MYFPWNKYEELPLSRRNTLQIFITNRCNLHCDGCFARNAMENNADISVEEYREAVLKFVKKDGKQINILGGEPLLHSNLQDFIKINQENKLKTTIYTNGYFLNKFKEKDFEGAKLRVSLYCKTGGVKAIDNLPKVDFPIDVCYMVSKDTTTEELLQTAKDVEKNYNCPVFFISSIRELDNPNKEFFEDTPVSMNVLNYKKLVHEFLEKYEGNMRIDVSKRGVFESTKTLPDNK